jgi:hypothetical protein
MASSFVKNGKYKDGIYWFRRNAVKVWRLLVLEMILVSCVEEKRFVGC